MRIAWGISFVAACLAGPALAQQGSAYDVGLRLAQGRGYANADCYARVFAKHAVVVEKQNGRRSWYASSTPAYNAEQRSRCGIDRLADLAERRQGAQRPTGQSLAGPSPQDGAYRHGLRIARQRGYSGSKAHCLANVFKSHATFQPSPLRAGVVDWSATISHALRGEMYSQCGIQI